MGKAFKLVPLHLLNVKSSDSENEIYNADKGQVDKRSMAQ